MTSIFLAQKGIENISGISNDFFRHYDKKLNIYWVFPSKEEVNCSKASVETFKEIANNLVSLKNIKLSTNVTGVGSGLTAV